MKDEKTGEISRVHSNRLAAIGPRERESQLNPAVSGVFPDTRELFSEIVEWKTLNDRLHVLVRFKGNENPVWIDEDQIPPIILVLIRKLMKESNSLGNLLAIIVINVDDNNSKQISETSFRLLNVGSFVNTLHQYHPVLLICINPAYLRLANFTVFLLVMLTSW